MQSAAFVPPRPPLTIEDSENPGTDIHLDASHAGFYSMFLVPEGKFQTGGESNSALHAHAQCELKQYLISADMAKQMAEQLHAETATPWAESER